jgi:hypothetical protein
VIVWERVCTFVCVSAFDCVRCVSVLMYVHVCLYGSALRIHAWVCAEYVWIRLCVCAKCVCVCARARM